VAELLAEAVGVTVRFGGLVAVNDASVPVPEGRIVGLIGPNGAGKTTLFATIAGFQKPNAGTIRFMGEDITRLAPHRRAALGIARTFQIVQPFAGLSVRENIAVGAHLRHAGRAEALAAAEALADRVGLGPLLNLPAAALTVAGRKRLELARALATDPKLLLLDEIAGGLTEGECAELVSTIRAIHARGVTIVWIEHVLHALTSVVERLLVLDFGKVIGIGKPDEIMASRQVREIYLGIEV
jgi:branched-chain amino acid transport system ATP-binding protein